MTTSVKYFDSTQAGAPTLTGQAGSLIALLDACLVDGFNLKSLTGISVSGGVATASCATAHGFPVQGIVLVAGATPSGLNGEKRVTWADNNTFKFDATGIPDGAASGTLSAKIAPAGWAKAFSGTNKAAYRAAAGNRHYLRVDNGTTIAANKALVYGCEAMTDVDTYDVRFPTAAQLASPMWKTSSTTDATARAWRLFADDRLFYLAVRWTTSYWHDLYCFGEIAPSFKVGDAYHTLISSIPYDDAYCRSASNLMTGYGEYFGTWISRSHTQLPGPSACCGFGSIPASGARTNVSRSNPDADINSHIVYPNAADNGLIIGPYYLRENAAASLRGVLPGLMCCWQGYPGADGDVIDTISNLPGKKVLLQAYGCYVASNSGLTGIRFTEGRVAVDLTGPWR